MHNRSQREGILVLFMRGAETGSVRGAHSSFRVVFWILEDFGTSVDAFPLGDKVRTVVRGEKKCVYGRMVSPP
jgi:hypothetical protein